jgi:hypothetical protein
MTPALIARRRAAHGLNQLVSHLELGTLGRRFYSDEPDQWSVVTVNQVIALKNGRKVAEVYMGRERATITVDDAYLLIRTQHLKEFDPQQYGIQVCTAHDFLGEKIRPDLEATVDVSEVPGLDLPERPLPKSPRRRKIQVTGSMKTKA